MSRKRPEAPVTPPARKRGLRITTVYTRTGDAGRTRLAGGQRVWKDSPRVEAYGTVDELNSLLGLVRAFLRAESSTGVTDGELDRELEWVQNKLFDLGGLLATAPGQAFPNMPTVSHTDVTRLEHRIDQRQEVLPPLKEFILPGGGVVTSLLHVARTVCRRAERLCVRLGRTERLDPMLVTFLNRLSDALFVFARHHAHLAAEPEPVWRREPS